MLWAVCDFRVRLSMRRVLQTKGLMAGSPPAGTVEPGKGGSRTKLSKTRVADPLWFLPARSAQESKFFGRPHGWETIRRLFAVPVFHRDNSHFTTPDVLNEHVLDMFRNQ
jgi:hypothetical protein